MKDNHKHLHKIKEKDVFHYFEYSILKQSKTKHELIPAYLSLIFSDPS